MDDQRTHADEFEDIVLLAQSSGALVTLGDVAEVREGFGEPASITELNGVPAAFVTVRASPAGASALAIRQEVDAMLADYAAPPGTDVSIWHDYSRQAATRLNLVRNTGILALALVFVVLVLAFDFRLATWVAVGLPVSFLGALALFPFFDLTINFATLYAMVIMLGILVDDAIVVGESIASQREQGLEGMEAAVVGARQVFWPVVVGVATTFLAFVPLLFAYGMIGQFLGVFPIVIGLVLAVSLIEAFLILPSHLSHSGPWSRWPLQPLQAGVNERINRLRDGAAVPAIAAATRRPTTTLAVTVLLVIGCAALFLGGAVRYGDVATSSSGVIEAHLTYPVGTPIESTGAGVRQLEEAANRTNAQLKGSPIASVATIVGHLEPRGICAAGVLAAIWRRWRCSCATSPNGPSAERKSKTRGGETSGGSSAPRVWFSPPPTTSRRPTTWRWPSSISTRTSLNAPSRTSPRQCVPCGARTAYRTPCYPGDDTSFCS